MADLNVPPQPTDPVPSGNGAESSLYPHLARAPIREALIYFRAELPPQFEVEVFRALGGSDPLRNYPQVEENRSLEQSVNFNPRLGIGKPGEIKNSLASFVFRSADQRNVAQFRRDGFVFSRLRPYTSWEEVFAEAWRLWKVYQAAAKPATITRIGVRYINQLTLPMEADALTAYLKAPPRLAPNWPSAVASFFSQVTLHIPEYEAIAQVTQTLEPTRKKGVLPVILDVDAFAMSMLNPADPGLARRFESLRDAKNRIFFGALTEKAINLFKQ